VGKVVNVEGLPGSGKTTLVTSLTELYDIWPVYEPVSDNPFLTKFYEDPGAHAFKMQAWLLNKRNAANKAAYWLSRTGCDTIVDRGRQGDRCFALVNWRMGNIDDDEMSVYEEQYESLGPRDPDVIVFLDIGEFEALTRIAKRGRECERDIDVGYLAALRREHERMVEEAAGRGVRIMTECNPDPLTLGRALGLKRRS